jgi:hypothetical protein
MFFAGLPLATLLTIGALAGAAIVVFYILKLRRRPVAVPFSRIWDRILRDKEATSLFSQLKRILSLLLQLLLLLLMLLALGDPRLRASFAEGRSIVVLVDASASMKATDVAPSRIEAAKRELGQLVRGLNGADRMLIAELDASLTALTTMTGEVGDLEAAVQHVRATDTRADVGRGLRFALDSLNGLSKPEIVLISDGAFGDPAEIARELELGGVELRYLPVGKRGKNVALTGFSVRRYPLDKSRYEVMLEVTNTNAEPSNVELTLFGDGDVVDVTRLALGPNERLPRFYKDLAGASRTLEAAIRPIDGAVDDLPADDRAYALMPERRRARVLVVTPGNTYLEAALLLDEYLDVTMLAPSKYPPAETYDVTIFDGVAPAPAKHTGSLFYIGLADTPAAPVKLGKKIEMFGFDTWDKKSPILRWMAMDDIQVATGSTLVPQQGDRVVGASDAGPILLAGRRSGKKFVALGFDPRQSDFVLRVAWPLFVLNVINDFIEEDTGYVSSYRTGEVWSMPAPSGVEIAQLVDPSGKRRNIPVKEGRAVYLGDQAGFYKLSVGSDPEPSTTMFAANLADLEESRIEPKKELALGGRPANAVVGFTPGVRREIWIYLLVALIVVSVMEWITYHRRITV